jgi:hypothetical protein
MKTNKITLPNFQQLTLIILASSTIMLTVLLPGLAQVKPEYLAENIELAQNHYVCPLPPRVEPARETKKVTVSNLGFSFNLPVNYRIDEDQQNNRVSFYNPADDQLIACCRNNNIRGCGHSTIHVTISAKPATSNTALLPELEITKLRLENVRPTTIANQKAMVYILKSSMDGGENLDTSLEARFLTPDKQQKITISVFNHDDEIPKTEQQVFNLVISSLSLI